jgi:hypothetical protein
MITPWLDYLPALEQAIAMMSSELEALQFRGPWSPEHKTKGLQNLQQLRQAWTQNYLHREALEHLKALSSSAVLKNNRRFRAELERIEQCGQELQEVLVPPNKKPN